MFAAPGHHAQASQPHSRPGKSAGGQKTFSSLCAACHGLDGRGGERAPSIATTPRVQNLSDFDLSRIVSNGVAGTGMPAFSSLSKQDVKAVVDYLRVLQGKGASAPLPGDPQNGKLLFFGRAGCSACHMAHGEGGFIASDLSANSTARSAEEIRQAIISPRANRPGQKRVIATTRDGLKLDGIARNEDNFSIQMQTLDGEFHFLTRADLQSLEYPAQTLMPSNYASTLTVRELDDIVSYLLILSRDLPAPKKHQDDD